MTPANDSRIVKIRRPVTGSFTQIQNDLLGDAELSWKATGLLAYLLSLRAGYRISLEGLCKRKIDKEASVRSGMKELEALGYLKIVRKRSVSGQFLGMTWLVSDYRIMDWGPYLENPAMVQQVLDEPSEAFQEPTNTKLVSIPKNSITTTSVIVLPQMEAAESRFHHEAWSWLCERLSIDAEQTRQQSRGLAPDVALNALIETYSCKVQGGVKKSVDQLLRALLERAAMGKFNLSAGRQIKKDLPAILARQRAVAEAYRSAPQKSASPEVLESSEQEKLAAREQLKILKEITKQRFA